MADEDEKKIEEDRDVVTKEIVEEARTELVTAQAFYESCVAARKTTIFETEKARKTVGALEALLQQTIALESEARKRVLEYKDRYSALVLQQSKELDS